MIEQNLLFPSQPGTYALIMRCSQSSQVSCGALGLLHIQPGWYIYIGSAFGPGGLRSRLSRHLDSSRPQRWHIDALKPAVKIHSIWLTTDPRRLEHAWAAACLAAPGLAVPWHRFGASDCRCPAHLFYSVNQPDLPTPHAIKAFLRLGQRFRVFPPGAEVQLPFRK